LQEVLQPRPYPRPRRRSRSEGIRTASSHMPQLPAPLWLWLVCLGLVSSSSPRSRSALEGTPPWCLLRGRTLKASGSLFSHHSSRLPGLRGRGLVRGLWTLACARCGTTFKGALACSPTSCIVVGRSTVAASIGRSTTPDQKLPWSVVCKFLFSIARLTVRLVSTVTPTQPVAAAWGNNRYLVVGVTQPSVSVNDGVTWSQLTTTQHPTPGGNGMWGVGLYR
jgi:hypothetical protein